jgi:hypothetical protein
MDTHARGRRQTPSPHTHTRVAGELPQRRAHAHVPMDERGEGEVESGSVGIANRICRYYNEAIFSCRKDFAQTCLRRAGHDCKSTLCAVRAWISGVDTCAVGRRRTTTTTHPSLPRQRYSLVATLYQASTSMGRPHTMTEDRTTREPARHTGTNQGCPTRAAGHWQSE